MPRRFEIAVQPEVLDATGGGAIKIQSYPLDTLSIDSILRGFLHSTRSISEAAPA